MNHELKIAIKTYLKVLEEALEPIETGRDMDYEFDYGEYSCAVYDRLAYDKQTEILNKVSLRFNINPKTLENEAMNYQYNENDILLCKLTEKGKTLQINF